MIRRPPILSWRRNASGTSGPPAATRIASKGAASGHPKVPSPCRTSTLAYFSLSSARRAPVREIAMPLDAVDLAGQSAQNRRRVARSGADIEDAVAGLDLGGFDHQRDNVRLRDSLAGAMGSGAVFVGEFLHSRANESLARHLSHGFEHARVSDTSPGHLEGDHSLALDRAILDWCGHFCHMVQTFGWWRALQGRLFLGCVAAVRLLDCCKRLRIRHKVYVTGLAYGDSPPFAQK